VCNPPGSAACLPLAGLILNVADLRISGVEAATNLKYEGLTIGGNMAYTKVHVIKSYLPQAFIDAYTAALGANPPLPPIAISNSPKWQLNGNIGYQLPTEVFGGTLSIDFDIHHQSAYLTTDVVVPAWTSVDSQVTLDEIAGRPISARFYVRNLFDKTYFVGSASNAASTGIFSFIKGAPRTFGVSVRYKFGEQ
jgi:iron complex outermembrane receptor protein